MDHFLPGSLDFPEKEQRRFRVLQPEGHPDRHGQQRTGANRPRLRADRPGHRYGRDPSGCQPLDVREGFLVVWLDGSLARRCLFLLLLGDMECGILRSVDRRHAIDIQGIRAPDHLGHAHFRWSWPGGIRGLVRFSQLRHDQGGSVRWIRWLAAEDLDSWDRSARDSTGRNGDLVGSGGPACNGPDLFDRRLGDLGTTSRVPFDDPSASRAPLGHGCGARGRSESTCRSMDDGRPLTLGPAQPQTGRDAKKVGY